MVKRKPVLEGAAQALGLEFVPNPGDVSTHQVAGTQLLEISVRDTDPQRARALADEIANQLILKSPTASQEQERQTFIQERLAGLESKIQETESGIEEEQEKLEAANSARAIQQYQANIDALQQKLSSYESTYASLLISAQGGANTISIVERASTPQTPISPNVPETVALSGAIGLGLAIGGAVLIEFMDDTIKSPEEAVRMSEGESILATIAEVPGKDYPDRLIAAQQPLSPITEAFRVLRSNIQFASVDNPVHALMVTSPGPSQGKSLTIANLAVVLANAGQKVVLVDTDLRRPVLHRVFELPNDEGFCDAILDAQSSTVMQYAQPTQVENLYLMTSGSIPPNPAELLSSGHATELIDVLKTQADIVLFDSPPTLVVADAAILGAKVDGVLMINEMGNTRRAMARRAIEEMERAHARVLGLVINRMAAKYGGEYYYRYYQYYYYRDGERTRRDQPSGPFKWVSNLFGSNGHDVEEPEKHPTQIDR
jgi:non-specific protein-tyrosine kinase